MTAYRFCRSDDVPLIVDAYERCNVGAGARPWKLTAEHMKRLGREMNLWTSSCMVAFEGSDPIGVLVAAKREPIASLVLHVAVHPDHRRRGHGRHMMTSLSQKMAILEPTLMLVELPDDDALGHRFFKACGFTERDVLTDYTCEGDAPAGVPGVAARGGSARRTENGQAPGQQGATRERTGLYSTEEQRRWAGCMAGRMQRDFRHGLLNLVAGVSAAELVSQADFEAVPELDRCWQRSPRSVRNLRDRPRGLAIATDRDFEAWLLHRSDGEAEAPLPFLAAPLAGRSVEVLALGGKMPVPALVRPLLAVASNRAGRPLHLPRVHPSELPAGRLEEVGFRPGARTIRYESDAAPT